jgi:hypothetical protein
MHLLDTDTLTHLYAGQPNVVERLRTVDDPEVGITIIYRVYQGRSHHSFCDFIGKLAIA